MSGMLQGRFWNAASGGATSTYNGVANFSGSKYFSRTPGVSGSQRKFTFSAWVKRSATGETGYFWMGDTGGTTNSVLFRFDASNKLVAAFTGAGTSIVSTPTYTSTTTWYHVTLAIDTDQATAANRARMYINDAEPALSSSVYPSLNADMRINTASYQNTVGGNPFAANTLMMAYPQFVDGTQATYTDFNQSGGSGKVPKLYAGAFGTNGWALDFANTSSLGTDVSGVANTMAVNSIVAGDASSQTVTF